MVKTWTKRTTEIRDVEADFAGYAEIKAGATISSATVTTTGTGLTLDPAVIAGAKVQAKSSGGTNLKRYPLKFEATLSTGRRIVQYGRLYIVDIEA